MLFGRETTGSAIVLYTLSATRSTTAAETILNGKPVKTFVVWPSRKKSGKNNEYTA